MRTPSTRGHRLPIWPVALVLLAWTGAGPVARQTVSEPFVGIRYVERVEHTPREIRAHIVVVDLSAPGIRVKLTPPSGSRETVRQTTLEFLRKERAQVAVNAHFFWPFPSADRDVALIGLAASDGVVYSGFESPAQNYALVADAPAINIDADNRASVVHRDPSSADARRVHESTTLWTALAGAAAIVTRGQVTVPTYRDADHPDAALTPGGPGQYSNAKSWYEVPTARTAIGLSQDARRLTIFTVDARGGSAGMTVPEVAAMVVADYGVWNALNLDGGGSTSLAMEDPATGTSALVNTSSDNPAGRAVGSNLAIFARRR